MLSNRGRQKLIDIREHIAYVRGWIANVTFEEFCADRRTYFAVIRALEVISEASRGIDAETKARHPEMSWTDIAGAGNIYRHDYDDLTVERIWRTAKERLEPLLVVVEAELAASPD